MVADLLYRQKSLRSHYLCAELYVVVQLFQHWGKLFQLSFQALARLGRRGEHLLHVRVKPVPREQCHIVEEILLGTVGLGVLVRASFSHRVLQLLWLLEPLYDSGREDLRGPRERSEVLLQKLQHFFSGLNLRALFWGRKAVFYQLLALVEYQELSLQLRVERRGV